MGISDTIRERLGVDLGTFAGAHLTGEVPLSDDFVNRLIAERLANHAQIASVHVRAQEGDAIDAQVVPRVRLLPSLRVVAHVERQPEFPDNPLLILRWSMPAAGPLARFAAPLLSHFKSMPPGIRIDGDHVGIDLREMLRSRGFEDVLGLIRRLEIHTRPGGFVARFELGV